MPQRFYPPFRHIAPPLTAADLKAAANLKRIWNREKAERRFTRQSAAVALGWKSAGTVSQYLNGKSRLSITATVKFAKFLGVHPFEIRLDVDLPYCLVPYQEPESGDK